MNLNGLHVMLSASLPKALEGTRRAQELFDVMVTLIGGVLRSSGVLVFGGHPTVTPLVHRIALSAGPPEEPRIKLFQLNRHREQAPEEVNDQRVFGEVRWLGDAGAPLDEDLAELRSEMVEASHAGIFIGGKTQDYLGRVPGVRAEYERFAEMRPDGPAYLLGILGGEALRLIKSLEREGRREANSLSEDELRAVHYSDNVDLIFPIILNDLQRLADGRAADVRGWLREG
jgi:hypothetical protein